jgi:hypothetical protein
MPVPLTRRHAIAVELRRVLEHPGRGAPVPSPPPPAGSEGLRHDSPAYPQPPQPRSPKPRGRG